MVRVYTAGTGAERQSRVLRLLCSDTCSSPRSTDRSEPSGGAGDAPHGNSPEGLLHAQRGGPEHAGGRLDPDCGVGWTGAPVDVKGTVGPMWGPGLGRARPGLGRARPGLARCFSTIKPWRCALLWCLPCVLGGIGNQGSQAPHGFWVCFDR